MTINIKPGKFYYGHPCPSCSDFLYIAIDDEHGRGPPSTITGPPRKRRCPYCKDEVIFSPRRYERRQAPGTEEAQG